VWLPSATAVNGHRVSDVERALEARPADARLPVVLYVHGCHGLDDDLTQWASVLTAAGYAVFAPDASARPPGCRDATLYQRGDLAGFASREAEVRYALRQLRTLRWVVQPSVFLLGFDHGGVIVAGWREREFAGFIVTGWTCTSPDVRHGLFTPADRPVLAIRWAEDPRFRDPAWNGDCEAHLADRPGSRSLVLEGLGHSTAANPQAREAVVRFLRANTAR
jgi:dienelactone hydrolase